jgi:hypothetical protein
MDFSNLSSCDLTIGICTGAEYAFPESFMALIDWISQFITSRGGPRIVTDYVHEKPFDSTIMSAYNVVIDRISHQRPFIAEWLKKVCLDGCYVINNPHHFQSRKKNFGYCSAAKLGLDVPKTFLLPPKTSTIDWRNMEPGFDIVATGSEVGYPMYMKPYDGGGWRNVSRVFEPAGLKDSYIVSGGMIMNIQEEINYDYFIRCICIGSSVLPVEYDPEAYHHERYAVKNRVPTEILEKCARLSRIISGFLGFEMNSVEILVQTHQDNQGKEIMDKAYLIDFNNPVPDMSLVSLHKYFPSVISEMLKRALFAGLTSRKYPFHTNISEYLDVAAQNCGLNEKILKYNDLAGNFFGRNEFLEFSRAYFTPEFEKAINEMFEGPEFELIMKKEIYDTFHDQTDKLKYERFLKKYQDLNRKNKEKDSLFFT